VVNKYKSVLLGTLLLAVALSPMWGHIYGVFDPTSPAAVTVV
jgi:hypothetical protein